MVSLGSGWLLRLSTTNNLPLWGTEINPAAIVTSSLIEEGRRSCAVARSDARMASAIQKVTALFISSPRLGNSDSPVPCKARGREGGLPPPSLQEASSQSVSDTKHSDSPVPCRASGQEGWFTPAFPQPMKTLPS